MKKALADLRRSLSAKLARDDYKPFNRATVYSGSLAVVEWAQHFHHVIDIPPVLPAVTKYITESGTCAGCGQRWNSQPSASNSPSH